MSKKEFTPGDETAARWVARLHSDQVTASDRAEFEAWRARDAANAEEFAAHNEIWEAVGAIANSPEARNLLLRPTPSSVLKRPLLNGSRRYWLAAAASAAAGAAIWAIPRGGARAQEFRSGRGEHRTVALEDGSTAALNTESVVQVSMLQNERRLLLEQGQCFLDVAKDPARPFRVFAGGHEIRALGTAFDVYKNGATVQVTMTEGKVAIYDAAATAPVFSLYDRIIGASRDPESVSAVISAGKQATIAPSSPIRIEDVDVRRAEAWRAGEVIFDETSLDDALRDVNRYATRQIVLGDASLAPLKVSGVFQIAHLDRFAQALVDNFGLRIEAGDSTAIVVSAP